MLASRPDFALVRVVGAFVIVAVTAVPLEETVMRVCPIEFVVIATKVAVGPLPSMEVRPGVSVRVAEPRVIWPSAVIVGADSREVTDGPGSGSVP